MTSSAPNWPKPENPRTGCVNGIAKGHEFTRAANRIVRVPDASRKGTSGEPTQCVGRVPQTPNTQKPCHPERSPPRRTESKDLRLLLPLHFARPQPNGPACFPIPYPLLLRRSQSHARTQSLIPALFTRAKVTTSRLSGSNLKEIQVATRARRLRGNYARTSALHQELPWCPRDEVVASRQCFVLSDRSG